MNAHIIFDPFQIEHGIQMDLDDFVVGFYEDTPLLDGNIRLDRTSFQFELALCFLGRRQEVGIADRLEQVIECFDAEPLDSVLFERCNKNDFHLRRQQTREFQSAEIRHLDVEKQQFGLHPITDSLHSTECIGVGTGRFQERCLVYISFDQFAGQRFVIDHYGTQ